MAGVSNTIQGLNQTLDLLSQILQEVRKTNAERKDIQPGDVSSSTKTATSSETSSVDIKNTVEAINAINKVDTKDIVEKSSAINETLKIITSKQLAGGIFGFGILSAMGLVKAFNKGIHLLFETMSTISNMNINTKNLSEINKVVKSFTESVNEMMKLMLKLTGFIVACVAVGAIGIYFYKEIFTGFGIIATIATGVGLLYWGFSYIAKYAENASEDFITFTKSLYSLAGVILVAAAVGALASIASNIIWKGLWIIGVTVFATIGLYFLLQLAGKYASDKETNFITFTYALYSLAGIVLVAAAVGVIAHFWSKFIWKGLGMIAVTTLMTIGLFALVNLAGRLATNSVKEFLMFTYALYSLAGIVLVATLVGFITTKWSEYVWKGLGIIGLTVLGTIGLFALVNLAGTIASGAMPSFLLMIVGIAGLALVTQYIIYIGKQLEEAGGATNAFKVLGIMTTLILAVGGLAALAGGISSLLLVGSIAIAAMGGVLLLMSKVIVDLFDTYTRIGGTTSYSRINIVFDAMKIVATRMASLMFEIGTANPFKAVIMANGIITLKNIAKVTNELATTLTVILDAAKTIDEIGGVKTFDEKSASLTTAITTFIKETFAALNPYKDCAKEFKKLLKPIAGLINLSSKFVKMLSKYTMVGDNLAPIFYNEDGSYTIGAPVNIKSSAATIANAFVIFTETIMDRLKKYDKKQAKAVKKVAQTINTMMGPVNKFANIMKSFTETSKGEFQMFVTKDGEIVFDKDGNPKTVSLDISKVATTIGDAFATFSDKLIEKLRIINTDGISKQTTKVLDGAIKPVTSFVEAIYNLEIDKDGHIAKDGTKINLSELGTTIGTAIGNFVKNFDAGLPSVDGGWFSGVNNKKKLIESYGSIISTISDFANAAQNLKADTATPLLSDMLKFITDIQEIEDDKRENIITIVKNTKDLTETLFDNAKQKIKDLKEYYENTKLIAEQMERTADAMDRIAKHADTEIKINSNVNTTPQQNNGTTTSNSSGNVTTTPQTNIQNNTTINGNSDNNQKQIDFTEITKAIREGFTGITKMTVVLDSGDEVDLSMMFGK